MNDIIKQETAVDMTKYRNVMMTADFAKLTEDERFNWLIHTCQKINLDPITKPIEFITLNGKLKPYFTRMATDEIRSNKNIHIELTDRTIDKDLGIISITVKASTPEGRVDFATGIVAMPNGPENIANAIMKAETKAKRRVTLSICGLGFTDESELDTIQNLITPAENVRATVKRPALPPMEITGAKYKKAEILVKPQTPAEIMARYESVMKLIKRAYPDAKEMLGIALGRATQGDDDSYRAVLRFFTGEENMNNVDIKQASIMVKWLQYDKSPDWEPAAVTMEEIKNIVTEMMPEGAWNEDVAGIEAESNGFEDDTFDKIIDSRPPQKRKFDFNTAGDSNERN